jgi:hypothetical protein
MVAFGWSYIANPDLVERLATGAPFAEVDWETVYASGPARLFRLSDDPPRSRLIHSTRKETDMTKTTPEIRRPSSKQSGPCSTSGTTPRPSVSGRPPISSTVLLSRRGARGSSNLSRRHRSCITRTR